MVPALPCPTCDASIEFEHAPPDACPECGRALVVCGEYRIRALLGRGGMATVYEAAHELDGTRVAVKVLWFLATNPYGFGTISGTHATPAERLRTVWRSVRGAIGLPQGT